MSEINKKIQKKKKGFTLVELLVGIGIFSIVVSVVISLFISAILVQGTIVRYQRLLNEISYTAEYMSRSLRMADLDEANVCGVGEEHYKIEQDGRKVTFLNANSNECWSFYLDNRKLMVERKKITEDEGRQYSLTAEDAKVENFKVKVTGDEGSGIPKITFTLWVKMRNASHFYSLPKIIIQSTVSPRNF